MRLASSSGEVRLLRNDVAKEERARHGLESGWNPEASGIRLCLLPRCVCARRCHQPLDRRPLLQYTGAYEAGNPKIKQQATLLGNSTKSMRNSVEASLKKLRTTYIDILYVHWWDWTTSVEELMDGLHNLIAQGKVLYLVRGQRIYAGKRSVN